MFPPRPLLFLIVIVGLSSCNSRTADPPQREAGPNSEEDAYLCQLSAGSVDGKIKAANRLKEMRSVRAVPYLLREARKCSELARRSIREPIEGSEFSHAYNCYVVIDGKKQPYIDYHEPIFSALASLSLPYFEPDEKWYAKIEEWCKERKLGTARD